MQSEQFTPVPGGYRFSVARELGAVKLVIIDSRNGRVLQPGARAIVDDAEWGWIVDQCNVDVDHLLIGSSLPVFVPGGDARPAALERGGDRRCMGPPATDDAASPPRCPAARRGVAAPGDRHGGLAGVRPLVRRARRDDRRAGQRSRTAGAGIDQRAVRRHPLQLPRPDPLPVAAGLDRPRPSARQLADPQRADATGEARHAHRLVAHRHARRRGRCGARPDCAGHRCTGGWTTARCGTTASAS